MEKSQLDLGIEVEMEHRRVYEWAVFSGMKCITLEEFCKAIALDHIAEDPEYYTKLLKMENE